jgi:hypothetical protein
VESSDGDIPQLPTFPRPFSRSTHGESSSNLPPSSTMCSPTLQVKVDDFVVAKILPMPSTRRRGNRKPVFYVGYVVRSINCVDKSESGWEIQCLRKHQNKSNQFIYPDENDITFYPNDDIVRILSPLKVAHRVYHFSDDLSVFASNMR